MDKNMNVLISAVIPVFNSEKYLKNCLDSIISQDYKTFECILVNDGSTDRSEEICLEYAEKDRRFKVISKENGGVSSARNFGIERASGKYITFIDSDDYLEPNYFSVLLDAMEKNEVQISMCGYIFETEKGKEIYHIEKKNDVLSREEIIKNMYVPINRSWGSFSCNKMFQTEIIQKNNIRYDEKFIIFEDALFVYQYMKYVEKGYFDTSSTYHYVKRSDSITNSVICSKSEKRWTEYTIPFEIILNDAENKDEIYFKQVLSMKWIHGCTAIRAMASMGIKNHPRYKAERKFLKKHFVSQILNKDIPIGKRLGALLTLLMPKTAYKAWVKKNG